MHVRAELPIYDIFLKIKTQLQDCDIYLLDHTAAVTVDDCSNCRILTGPVASRYSAGLRCTADFC